MILRKTLFLPLMAASIGGPFLFLAGENDSDPQKDQQEELSLDLSVDSGSTANTPSKVIYRPVQDYGEIFNFNLTASSIEARWKNATRSSINGYQIYRSSLLLGHGPQDPVGAITYQFKDGSLRQIEFTGLVGDPSRLVEFISGRFGFARADSGSSEFRPTTFSGHAGSLKLTQSKKHQGQIEIALVIGR